MQKRKKGYAQAEAGTAGDPADGAATGTV